MAYNLQPLITILEQILNPEQTWCINLDHNEGQLQSLLQKAASLQRILEKSPLPRTEALEIRIREAVHEAEDIIEARMVDRILCRSLFRWLTTWCGGCFTFSSPPDLQQVMQELDSAMAQVEKLVELEGGKMPLSRGLPSTRGASSLLTDDPSSKSVVAGVSQDLKQLRDRLIGTQSKLEIVPIVGMGGIGKTTLALMLYRDPSILHHFKYRAWATISQDFDMKAVLSSLLSCINGKRFEDYIIKESGELKEIMYRSLFGRRYMIVLDDIWNAAFWDEMRKYFPDNNNGSRIVITTRESEVANHVDSRSLHHRVQLLSKSRSWSLLRRIVFGKEDCPDALRGVGKRIALVCSGLPLAVNVMGGLLSRLERSKDVWESIASNASAALQFGERFSNILSLSYNHLPYHLKPCFLYMGAFPEDYVIKGSALVRLWIAEGFVKSNGNDESGRLEEEAEDYLKALVQRNLLMVKESKCNGEPKSYMMHDLLRDLCTRKADEERFLRVAKNASEYDCNLRRISCAYGLSELDPPRAEFSSRARTFLCSSSHSTYHETPPCLFSAMRLLRVLDLMKLYFLYFPTEILLLVNLRYLAVSCDSSLPSRISRLRRLRTLIADVGEGPVPFEICELPELRHLKVRSKTMIGIKEGYRVEFILKKLHTLSVVCVTNSLLRSGFFESIPSIALLSIYFEDYPLSTVDLRHLRELRSLICEANWAKHGCLFMPRVMFPSSLRKLSLVSCVVYGRLLALLCGLPNLEVLKLMKCRFRREEGAEVGGWEAAEGDEFRSLQVLHLDAVELLVWTADETNFPRLRRLVLRSCSQQLEIPSGIGEILTLEMIDLYRCSGSVVASAERILEVQQSDYGNYGLKLVVSS